MKPFIQSFAALVAGVAPLAVAGYTVSTAPFTILIKNGSHTIVENSAVLTGSSNTTVVPLPANNSGLVSYNQISSNVIKVSVNSTSAFVGAQFSVCPSASFYGVWEYPWDNKLTNDVAFPLEGVGNAEGVNWDNARAPFYITTAGYGVYADTLDIGYYDFTTPGLAQFVFNTSSLVYYIILPAAPGDYKSIITEYTSLSARIELPPDSGYGPEFWSDDFEEDFHGTVSNAQENYYDVINHLYYNQIRATSMFADRPYGTGNMSWGNFDFDPVYYPTPQEFIANLSTWGFDFQVWVANRAFLNTQLYNDSVANGWLFPGIDPVQFLGPALNLSIPAAYNYFKQHISYFPSVGVKGYKVDRGEEGEMPDYEQNIQQQLFLQLCHETMVEKWGESNFYTFARNAPDRSRALTAIWNGDSHSNYTGLSYSITSAIRAGLLAFSQWAVDSGGYVRGLNDPSEDLWARWLHFSTFTPSFEIMVGTNHTPWYPPYTERLVNILKSTTELHTQLIPYIRSYTYEATQTGIPVIRALFLEFPEDDSVYSIGDEYIFGSEFLIAPIASASGQRTVYFPQGAKFLEWFNKTAVHPGGSTATIALELEYVPAYVREGSIVVTGDVYQGNAKWISDWQPWLEINVFPSFDVAESRFGYYNSETKSVVNVTAGTERGSGSEGKVTINWGALGVSDARLVVWGKDGCVSNVTIESTGGAVVVENFSSIFD